MSKTFVGILVMTKLKLSDDSQEELVAILQRRGKINTENDYGFKWQSFSGLCDITAYGKAEKDETVETALRREMEEELGLKATETILKNKPIKIYEEARPSGENYNIWAVKCDKGILKEMKLDISTGGIEIIDNKKIDSLNFTSFSGKGATEKNLDKLTVFEIPLEVIRKAFTLFK